MRAAEAAACCGGRTPGSPGPARPPGAAVWPVGATPRKRPGPRRLRAPCGPGRAGGGQRAALGAERPWPTPVSAPAPDPGCGRSTPATAGIPARHRQHGPGRGSCLDRAAGAGFASPGYLVLRMVLGPASPRCSQGRTAVQWSSCSPRCSQGLRRAAFHQGFIIAAARVYRSSLGRRPRPASGPAACQGSGQVDSAAGASALYEALFM